MPARIATFALSAIILSSPTAAATSAKVNAPIVVGTFKEWVNPVQLPDGRLMASFVRKKPEAYQFAARFSEDGGRSWTDPQDLLHLFEVGVGQGGQILTLPDGKHHAFLLNDANTGGRGRQDIWQVESQDGHRWEGLRQICLGQTTSLNSVIQLRSGRILLPFSYRTKRSWDKTAGRVQTALALWGTSARHSSTLTMKGRPGSSRLPSSRLPHQTRPRP